MATPPLRAEVVRAMDELEALIQEQDAQMLRLEKTLAEMAEAEGASGAASGYDIPGMYRDLYERRKAHGALKRQFRDAQRQHGYTPEKLQLFRRRAIRERLGRGGRAMLDALERDHHARQREQHRPATPLYGHNDARFQQRLNAQLGIDKSS
jgi:hypothetical protein